MTSQTSITATVMIQALDHFALASTAKNGTGYVMHGTNGLPNIVSLHGAYATSGKNYSLKRRYSI